MSENEFLLQQFGGAIKTARLSKGISAESLALKVGISRSTLWSMEKGNGNASMNTYLDIAQILGLNFSMSFATDVTEERKRSPRRITKEKKKKIQFEVFCIEKYARHANKDSSEVYSIFKKEKLLDLLREDYEDLHGMGIEYLMDFFDSYLERGE